MRPIADQFADRLPVRRAMRRPLIGAAALILLVVLLSACGGPPQSAQPKTDSDLPTERSRESWQAELGAVELNMSADPQEAYWPYRAAEIQVALDSTEQAIASLDQALALDPDYAPALLLLSKLLYDTERYEAAAVLLEDALDRAPTESDPLRMALAINLEALGELDLAEAQLALCAKDPDRRRAVETFISLRGDAYMESLEIATSAVESDPESASNHNNHGVALLYDGRPEAAREAFLRALERDPQLAGALYNLAIVETYYFYDLEKGRSWFERYAQLETEDPDELGAVFGVDLASRGGAKSSSEISSADTGERHGQ